MKPFVSGSYVSMRILVVNYHYSRLDEISFLAYLSFQVLKPILESNLKKLWHLITFQIMIYSSRLDQISVLEFLNLRGVSFDSIQNLLAHL
jgi:hypothetical protein